MTLSGNPFDYLLAFTGGILVSFTPCIYPLIPVSAGYIGAASSNSRAKGFFLSLSYVTGMALTYSLLGVIASLSGTIFGRISVNPITHIIVGLIIFLFGLSLTDIPILNMPGLGRIPLFNKKGCLPAFLLGLSSGLMISPCLTPVLGAILLYLATKKNIFYGASLLFCFAYGMGLILILIGTFSALLANLPKSGEWLVRVKKALAFVLMAVAVYFIYSGIRRL